MTLKLSVLLPQSQSPPFLSVVTAVNLEERKRKKSALIELIGNKF